MRPQRSTSHLRPTTPETWDSVVPSRPDEMGTAPAPGIGRTLLFVFRYPNAVPEAEKDGIKSYWEMVS